MFDPKQPTPAEPGVSFWRKETPIITDNGVVIKGGMWPHQLSWWEAPNFIKALVTGYGGGKTLIGSKRSISLALHNAPSPHIWVSPTYKMARRTAVPTIKALLDGKQQLTRGALKYRYNKSEFEFTINYNGREAVIWVTSGEDPDSLKGPNIGSAIIDEPFIQDREVFDQIMARLRDPEAKKLELGLTGTPEDLNWGYDICEGEERENFDIAVIHASSRANRALVGAYADRLESTLTAKAAEAYVEGKFVSLSTGLVYYGFSDENVKDLPDPGHELFVGMDFNVNPMAAGVMWRNGNHVHIMDEIELPNADTEFMCQELRERYSQRVREIFPDASGKARHTNAPAGRSDYTIIREHQFEINAPPANPPRRDRYNAVNGKLRPKEGPPTLTISPKCKRLISYMKQYAYEKMNDQTHMSHLLDAIGYPIVRLFPIKMDTATTVRLHGA